MGRSETPRIFAQAFRAPVARWLIPKYMTTDAPMVLQEPGGKKSNGSIVGFADDLFKKHLVPIGLCGGGLGDSEGELGAHQQGIGGVQLQAERGKEGGHTKAEEP